MRGNLSRAAPHLLLSSQLPWWAFALLGGVGQAQNEKPVLAQSQYGHKVTICHKGKHTIKISIRAWPAHHRHGDSVGTCAEAKKKAHARRLHARKEHAKKEHAEACGGRQEAEAEHNARRREPRPSRPPVRATGTAEWQEPGEEVHAD